MVLITITKPSCLPAYSVIFAFFHDPSLQKPWNLFEPQLIGRSLNQLSPCGKQHGGVMVCFGS